MKKMLLLELETRVLELYSRADEAVLQFQGKSVVGCPAGCVACCFSEKVEATMLELLPLALHLFRTNQAELLIKRLENKHDPRRCIFFRPDRAVLDGGGCSQYFFRPLICRLFGFAGSNDRHGNPRPGRCRLMQQLASPLAGNDARADFPSTWPLFSDYGMAITSLHPDLGTVRRPINIAMTATLLKVGLFLDLQAAPMTPQDSERPPEKPLRTPFRPKRAA